GDDALWPAEQGVGGSGALRAPGVAGRIDRRGQGHAPDEREEEPAERIEPELGAAERHEPVHGDGEGAPRDAAEPQDECDEPDRGGDEPAGRRHQRRRPITSRMAPRITAGEGGQPGTTASTGTTASAPPTIA